MSRAILKGVGDKLNLPMSLYWMFRLGFRSSLAMFRPSEAMYWMNIS